MNRIRSLFACSILVLSLVLSPSVWGQQAGYGPSNRGGAESFGLTRVWGTQVDLDSAKGQVAHISQHISSSDIKTIWQVAHYGKTLDFSEEEFDVFGKQVGPLGAAKRATAHLRALISELTVRPPDGLDMDILKATDQAADQVLANIDKEYERQETSPDPIIVDIGGVVAPLVSRQASTPPEIPMLIPTVVPEATLYITTNQGVVHAINAETGLTRWSVTVGQPDHQSLAPAANNDYVAVVNGSYLYLLAGETGALAWKRRLQGTPGAGPAINEETVFVPQLRRGLEAYSLYDLQREKRVAELQEDEQVNQRKYQRRFISAKRYMSSGRASIRPIATEDSIVWPTDIGYFYVASAHQQRTRFKLVTNDPIVAPPAYMAPQKLLVGSVDGYVYCVHELSGDILWRFSTGIPITHTPAPIGDSVYVIVDDGGMFRVSAETGQEKWWAPDIHGFVAASANRIYCTDRFGKMIVLDIETGGRFAAIPMEGLDVKFMNLQTDRLFVGTKTGQLQCLHEAQLEKPLFHVNIELEEDQSGSDEKKKAAAARKAAAKDDPFGAGAADPFGGGGAAKDADPFGGKADDPFGGGTKAADDDPFGTK